MRKDLRALQSMANEAENAKDRAIEEAEPIREGIDLQEPDSGRILAYEAVIEAHSVII